MCSNLGMENKMSSENKSLIEIIENAASQVQHLRYPNLSEFEKAMYPIFQVLESPINGDITDIEIDNVKLYVSYEWTARGCHDYSSATCPLSVIKSDDPILAAKIYAAKRKLSEAFDSYARCDREIESIIQRKASLSQKIEQLKKDLKELGE